MKNLKTFEAFSDYTDAIKNIGGKIGSKIGGILGNPSKAIKSGIKSVGNDIKNAVNSKIYKTEEWRLAAYALIIINDDYDKYDKLFVDFKETEESEKMLRYYIDMLPEKKEDLLMLAKLGENSTDLLLSPSKRKSLASRFKVPKFDGQSNRLSKNSTPFKVKDLRTSTPFYPGGKLL